MDVQGERQHLLGQIKEHAEPNHQAGMMMVTRTELKVYGVRVPHLREIARAWQRAHKDVTREDLMALVEALWDGKSREERLLVVYLLERYKRWIPDLTWAHFERWRRDLDNWEVADGLALWVLGRWLLANSEDRLAHLGDLIADEDVWSRRLALVETTPMGPRCSLGRNER